MSNVDGRRTDALYASSQPPPRALSIRNVIRAELLDHPLFFEADVPTIGQEEEQKRDRERRNGVEREAHTDQREDESQVHRIAAVAKQPIGHELRWRVERLDIRAYSRELSRAGNAYAES